MELTQTEIIRNANNNRYGHMAFEYVDKCNLLSIQSPNMRFAHFSIDFALEWGILQQGVEHGSGKICRSVTLCLGVEL